MLNEPSAEELLRQKRDFAYTLNGTNNFCHIKRDQNICDYLSRHPTKSPHTRKVKRMN